jgi:RND family efflux transporter MFP subunit
MKTNCFLYQCVCIVVVMAVVGCSSSHSTSTSETSIGQSNSPVAVKTVALLQQDVQRTTTQPATVHAFYRAEIRAKVSGYVKEVKADIGDFVKAGTVLCLIDVPEMQKRRHIIEARISRYESAEQRAAAGVELAIANVQSSKAKLNQAKSGLKGAQASLAAAEAEFSRTSDLVQRKSLQNRVLDEVRKKRDTELANQSVAESGVSSAAADVVVAQAKQSAAEADVLAAKAETVIAGRELEEADVLIAYAALKAPFDGIVTERSVDPGDLVREGSEVGNGEPLFTVSQVDRVRIRIPIPEVDAARVSRGDAVTLVFPSFPVETPITANVTRVSGELDPSTRTMLVEVEMANSGRKLLPGMFGQASISLSTKVSANTLPARAIRFDESGQAYVYIVGDDKSILRAQVTTGFDNGLSIEILNGLQPGQHVVDAHLKRFRTGQKVTVLPD